MGDDWIWARSNTPPKCKLTKWQKQARVAEAEEFVRIFYRAEFLPPTPVNPTFNYIVDFSVCWHGSYLRFVAKYACPGPNALMPFFEVPFARLGCFDSDRYNLWARRHNDQWMVLAADLTLREAFAEMRTNPWFRF